MGFASPETGPLETRLRTVAEGLGFTLFGIAPATDADTFPDYCRWLDQGYAGEMAYLQARKSQRQHPNSLLYAVRSVVMLGFEYGTQADSELDTPARIARYARGPDYHQLLWDRLDRLGNTLQDHQPAAQCRGVVDTAPLLERDFARRAGLGWFGKNTMLINKYRGSYFLLAALLTDVELTATEPFSKTHCGSCRACLDACPTQAFPEPGVLDARRCISYLTIELRGPIPEPLRQPIGDWLWGCDVCQEVCPWNSHAEPSGPFPSDPQLASLDPLELLGLSDAEFRQKFRGTVLFRGKRTGLLRNAAIVLGNTGDRTALPALQLAAEDADPVIAEAAQWAIRQIRCRHADGE